jgi:hypothetical protein
LGTGHMPPTHKRRGEGTHRHPYQANLNLKDTYCLSFDDPGYFFYFPMGFFSPELPMGYFPKGPLNKIFTPQKLGEITILFLDATTHKPYLEKLTICEGCESTGEPCPPTEPET